MLAVVIFPRACFVQFVCDFIFQLHKYLQQKHSFGEAKNFNFLSFDQSIIDVIIEPILLSCPKLWLRKLECKKMSILFYGNYG